MFFLQTIRAWFARRNRAIFTYTDGTKTRRADPLRIATALEAQCSEYMTLLGDAARNLETVPVGPLRDEMQKRKLVAGRALAQLAYKVFGLKELNDVDGVTEGEALRILYEFILFMETIAEESRLFGSAPEAA